MFEYLRYRVKVTQRSHDGGIDLELRRTELDGGQTREIAQCKRYASVVGVDEVRKLAGVVSNERSIAKGYLVTTSYFSDAARKFAENNASIVLIDGSRLKEIRAQMDARA